MTVKLFPCSFHQTLELDGTPTNQFSSRYIFSMSKSTSGNSILQLFDPFGELCFLNADDFNDKTGRAPSSSFGGGENVHSIEFVYPLGISLRFSDKNAISIFEYRKLERKRLPFETRRKANPRVWGFGMFLDHAGFSYDS